MIMLPKPGKNPSKLQSYRLISLLTILSKVFEKLLHRKLLTLLPVSALPEHQFGFRNKHSTVDQLQRVSSTILTSLEHKEFCAAAFLDVKQAFYKVWHDGLFYKLSRLLPSNVCDLLASYLTNRSFFVVYGNYISSTRPITAGIPQGSVLGPLLYTLFTADLPELPSATTATFADDTALLASSPNYHTAVADFQSALTTVHNWTSRWKIHLNSDKSVNTTFTLRPHPHQPVLLDQTVIPYKPTVKYLGIHLDERLTYAHHIRTKRRELDLRFRRLSWLLASKSPLSLANRRLLYMVVLRPVWMYTIPVWGCACNSLRLIIQRFQNKALRAIAGTPWYVRNDTLHADLRIPTVVETITALSQRHEKRLNHHPNMLALTLLDNSTTLRRLSRRHCADLVVSSSS